MIHSHTLGDFRFDCRACKSELIGSKPTFKDAELAFTEAISQGKLSDNPQAPNYAGNYMYMGTWNGKDAFKHIETRSYLNNNQERDQS